MRRCVQLRYLLAGLVGAITMFFLDPDRGAYRRNVTRDRLGGTARDAASDLARAGRHAGAEVYGAKEKLEHLASEQPPESDAVLTHKIESEVFRDRAIPKGDMNVNCVDGVVFLRGEVERSDLVELIDARVGRVFGVRDVVNLLHTPGARVE